MARIEQEELNLLKQGSELAALVLQMYLDFMHELCVLFVWRRN